MRPFAASLLIHVAGILALLTLDFRDSGAHVEPRAFRVTLLAPQDLRPASKPLPRPRRFLAPVRATFPKAILAPATVRTPPPILEALPQAPVLEAVRPAPTPAPPLSPPPLAPPPVKTGSFGEAPQLAAVAVPHLQIKTEGFGAAQIAAARLPGAPLTSTAGFDSTAPADAAPSRRSTAANAGFGDASVAAPHAAPYLTAAPRTTVSGILPVEILFKPRPAYPEAARRLRIEGEVLLQVRFEASGVVTVLGLIQGLGHGLDESAAEAASQIRFRPALRLGTPIGFDAIVHIVFQLAY